MRYYVVPQRIQQKTIVFTEEQMHHMRKVLRLKPGNEVECFDEKGNVYTVILKKLSKDACFGVVKEIEQHDLSEKVHLTILQAFPSALPKLDIVIEKCTELGTDKFIFFKSKRSEFYVMPSEEKISRWKKISIKASEQSQRFSVPEVHVTEKVEEVDLSEYKHKILLYEKSENLDLKTIISDLESGDKVLVAIGPEGGWEEKEVEKFKDLGFIDVKPFSYILRTETAPIAISAIINTLL